MSNLVFVLVRRIRDDPKKIEGGAPEQLPFAEYYILRLGSGKFYHHISGSRTHEFSTAQLPIHLGKVSEMPDVWKTADMVFLIVIIRRAFRG